MRKAVKLLKPISNERYFYVKPSKVSKVFVLTFGLFLFFDSLVFTENIWKFRVSEQKEGKRKWCVNHLSKLPGNICTFGLVIYEPFFVYFMLFQALLNIMFLDCHSLYSLPIISRAQTILAIFWQSYIWQNFCQMLCHIALAQKKQAPQWYSVMATAFLAKKM